MKWIKNRNIFLSEAKIKDLILPRQSKEVKNVWGESFLEYEEVIPTDKIKQGTWKLSEEDKRIVLSSFFSLRNIDNVYQVFSELPDKFCEILRGSININLINNEYKEKWKSTLLNFDIKSPSIDEIYLLYENVFRKISINETNAIEVIKKDENGKPILDDNGNIIKISKEKGDVVYTNNLVNINTFIEDYNRCFSGSIDSYSFRNGDILSIRNIAADDLSDGDYKIDFEIFKKDIYLSILHNPKDILNMSITKFYASCQHLYTGGYRSQVLGNVFDPNSIPAFLKFDTPIYWEDEKISDQLPLCRMMIRNIEGFTNSKDVKIFFDRCYPDRMEKVMGNIIRKYSENINNQSSDSTYIFAPDVKTTDRIREPYMDRLHILRGTYIGANSTQLYLTAKTDWSKTIISPKADIKELIIESVDLPSNFRDYNFNLNWVKFKYLKINSIESFKIKTKGFSFDKCSFTKSLLNEVSKSNPDITKLSFISCEIDDIDISIFNKLEELEIIYTIETDKLISEIIPDTIKLLTISSDILLNKDNKEFINSLKRSGKEVKIIGPKI